MSKLGHQFDDNSKQVRDAERRLASQHTLISVLRACAKDTTAAEKALEVMRDILQGLYYQRSQLRRRVAAPERAPARAGGGEKPGPRCKGPGRGKGRRLQT